MEYLKAWIFLQYANMKKEIEVDQTLLKYVEKLYDNMTNLVNTGLVKKTKTGNFVVAEIADFQVENRRLKEEIELARELLSNSKAFVFSMRLDHYEQKKKDFIERNGNAEIQN